MLEPPDQGLYVGNGFAVEAVNNAIAVYTAAGNRAGGPKALGQFLNLAPEIIRPTRPYVPFLRAVPVLLRHLGSVLGIEAPDLASLRALYARGRTLFDHQARACEILGVAWMTEHQRRALVPVPAR